MNALPPVTLIIPNFNGETLLLENLPSVMAALKAYPGGGRIVVVDDGSKDASVAVVRDHFSEVSLIQHTQNQGFSEAVHSGVRAAATEALIFLNSDVVPEEDFILPLIKRLEMPQVFSVQSAIREESGRLHPYCLTRFRYRLGTLKRLPTPELGHEGWLCLYASGGSMAVVRSKFLELGGFLPIYKPFYWEDFDLGVRAWRRGWQSWLEPASIVLHQERGSIRDHVKRQRIRWALERNKLIAEGIHLPLRDLLLWWPPRVLGRALLRTLGGHLGYWTGLFSALSLGGEVSAMRRSIKASERLSLERVLREINAQNRPLLEKARS